MPSTSFNPKLSQGLSPSGLMAFVLRVVLFLFASHLYTSWKVTSPRTAKNGMRPHGEEECTTSVAKPRLRRQGRSLGDCRLLDLERFPNRYSFARHMSAPLWHGTKIIQQTIPSGALQPTNVTGVTSEMQISDEEAFGPSFGSVLLIANHESQAIEIANGTEYGLNAAVYTTSMEHA